MRVSWTFYSKLDQFNFVQNFIGGTALNLNIGLFSVVIWFTYQYAYLLVLASTPYGPISLHKIIKTPLVRVH